MKTFKLFTLFSLLFFFSCGDEAATKDLTVNIRLVNDDAPVVGFQPFNYPDGYEMFLTKFSMFLSGIELEGESEGNFKFTDVQFIDLLDGVQSEEEALVGKSFVINDIPVDQYTRLYMNIGVPSDLNALSPSDFQSSSVLSNSGEYWAGWESYIFHKTEGKMDLNGDGTFDDNIAIHIGSNDAYREGSYSINLDLANTNTLNLTIDINDAYMTSEGPYDFESNPQIHHIGLLPLALPIMDALAQEISVR